MPQPLNPTIFILEDDPDIAGLLKHHLQPAGYGVSWFPTSAGLLDEMHARRPALVILDIMVPGNSGLDVAKSIRNNSALASIPIVFVTARTAESDRLRGFEIGADDYITKPFSPKEVVARVRAVLRRASAAAAPPAHEEDFFRGRLHVNFNTYEVAVDGQPLALSLREFELLKFFVQHPHRVYDRLQLLDLVWGQDVHVEPRTVDVHVRRLRKVIERDDSAPELLLTVRGVGYKFNPDALEP